MTSENWENLFILHGKWDDFLKFWPNLLEMMLDECVSRCPTMMNHWMHGA